MAKETRAGNAGRKLGLSIVEIAQLMYQNNTKKNFLKGILAVIKEALK